jgi:hypothetical protein
MKPFLAFALLTSLSLCPVCRAHVGSPDVYYDATAGPYRLFVIVRTPLMIPGIAQIEVRSLGPTPTAITVVPLRLMGEGSANAPPADHMTRSSSDPTSFTGKLWLMESGSWQIRVDAFGPQGKGEIAVPVPAFAQRTLGMQRTTGAILTFLMFFLVASLISIFGAAARESQLEPGQEVPASRRRKGRWAMAGVAVVVIAVLYLGNFWWTSLANAMALNMVYKAPPLEASLAGNQLRLKMGSSSWHEQRKEMQLTKIIPDHGHLMHLFLLRMPEMDRFYHLHPQESSDSDFTQSLASADAGQYAVFADIVRESGFPDTMTTQLALPSIPSGGATASSNIDPDDSEAAAIPISSAQPNAEFTFGDGERVQWLLDGQALHAGKPQILRFRVIDKSGFPARDLQPYMGMAGHLIVVRRDLSVFAHIHPAGSVPMAAIMLLQTAGATDDMAAMHSQPVPSEITFPYGFPQPGDFRLFFQIKRSGHVETSVFDTHVLP